MDRNFWVKVAADAEAFDRIQQSTSDLQERLRMRVKFLQVIQGFYEGE